MTSGSEKDVFEIKNKQRTNGNVKCLSCISDGWMLRALPSDSRLRDSSLRNPTAKCSLPMNGEGAF